MKYWIVSGMLVWLLCGGLTERIQAQTPDSLKIISREVDRRLQRRPSDLVRVVQVRELLAEQLQHGSVRAIPRLLAYLRATTADTTVALRPYEEWALLTVIGDLYPVTEQVRQFGQQGLSPRQAQQYERLPQDGLFDLAARRTAARQDTLRGLLRQTRFLAEDSTFLEVFITLLVPTDSLGAAASAQAQAVKGFLATYPDSEYSPFLRQFVPPAYQPARFSYGLDFHSGSALLLGQLPTYFRHGANLGLGFEFGWDRYQLYLRDYIGLGQVRQPLSYGGNWREGLRVNYFVPEASVGYRWLDGPRLRVVPFVGISALMISAANTQRDDPDNLLDLRFRHPLTVGVNVDVPLWRTQSRTALGYETGSWLLKLRAGVRSGAARQNATFKGGLLYLDVGIGGFGRMMKRQ